MSAMSFYGGLSSSSASGTVLAPSVGSSRQVMVVQPAGPAQGSAPNIQVSTPANSVRASQRRASTSTQNQQWLYFGLAPCRLLFVLADLLSHFSFCRVVLVLKTAALPLCNLVLECEFFYPVIIIFPLLFHTVLRVLFIPFQITLLYSNFLDVGFSIFFSLWTA